MANRREFLKGLIFAPAVIQYGHLMPVAAEPLPYLPGDLINFDIGTYKRTGWYARCEPLIRIEGRKLVFRRHQIGGYGEVRIPAEHCELHHGLPGNRVNNPSMRYRLVRNSTGCGLSYPEDLGST